MTDQNILYIEKKGYALIQLNRPKEKNALNQQLITELIACLKRAYHDKKINSVILYGGPHHFAAGADIKMILSMRFPDSYSEDFLGECAHITDFKKPIIAAVCGYALGGGCELAMMSDIIIAEESAQFGQPEIKLGIMPGLGGTQRLTRAVGKAKAMDLCLTGRFMSATEAEQAGLISRIVPKGEGLRVAEQIATELATLPIETVLMIKESIRYSLESHLEQGLLFEKRQFHSCFALPHYKEGCSAFLEKRKACFSD